MRVNYSKKFKKQYSKLPKKIREQCIKRLDLFLENPDSPQLRVHKLSGTYEGLQSFNVTGDVRVLFSVGTDEDILLTHIGTHSELYE